MRIFLTLPAIALLSACNAPSGPGPVSSPVAEPVSAPAPGADTCGRAPFEPLIGQAVGDGAAFRVAGSVFRVIYPGDVVTADVNPARLNIYASALGTIESLECF